MNQIIGTVALSLISSYGTTFMLKYAVECVTYQVVKKGTEAVKDVSKYAIYGKSKKIPRVIEYEMVNIDEYGNPILDEVCYVTSKNRTKSIDQSWMFETGPSATICPITTSIKTVETVGKVENVGKVEKVEKVEKIYISDETFEI